MTFEQIQDTMLTEFDGVVIAWAKKTFVFKREDNLYCPTAGKFVVLQLQKMYEKDIK